MIKVIDGNIFDSNAYVICHQTNCQGVMGSGVALQVKQLFPEVFEAYREEYEENGLELGDVIFVPTNSGKIIANLCAQNIFGYDGNLYTNYEKLQECLDKVRDNFNTTTTIAFPWMMSCCRGGGDWNIVYKMIDDTFKDYNVEIWRFNKG